MTRELHRENLIPNSIDITGIHTENKLSQSRVYELRDCSWHAGGVCLAPTNDTVRRLDPNQICIAFYCPTNAESNLVLLRDCKGNRIGGDFCYSL